MTFKSFQKKLRNEPVESPSRVRWLSLSGVPVYNIEHTHRTIYHKIKIPYKDKSIYIPLIKKGNGYIDDFAHPDYPKADMEKFGVSAWSIEHPLYMLNIESLYIKVKD